MNRYIYEGPVVAFDRCVAHKWTGTTYAVSEKKARSNLAFQYKRENKLSPLAKITLPAKLTISGEE